MQPPGSRNLDHVTAGEPIPGGLVTTADLYREMIGIRTDMVRAMTRIETADRERADHEARIRRLESFHLKLLGAAATVSLTASALGTWIGLNLHH